MARKKKVTGIIQIYSKKARDQIYEIGLMFAKEAGIPNVTDDVFACVDELIKNAVKANYKFLLVVQNIAAQMKKEHPDKNDEEIQKEIFNILKNRQTYDRIATKIISENYISEKVREILSQEGKYLNIRNRAYVEGRDYTPEERKKIAALTDFLEIRRQLKEKDIKIILKIEGDDDFIYIEVTNTAPILTRDLNRIYEKRDEYKIYREQGREQEFFINNIDTSDSGFGLGYATIDSFLAKLGLNPEHAITIISANNTTAMLTIPIALLR
ncbi:MAG: hypothetical protein N2316_06375 [Spirochaetes bacterium]|nr:hypothetical protein [Spirochaetota bacterium]